MSTLVLMNRSASFARREDGSPAMAMTGAPILLKKGKTSMTSRVFPLLDMKRPTSSLQTIPRSPWEASAACKKKEGVPKDARVAAIFLPISPDLPIPTTTTRPLQA